LQGNAGEPLVVDGREGLEVIVSFFRERAAALGANGVLLDQRPFSNGKRRAYATAVRCRTKSLR